MSSSMGHEAVSAKYGVGIRPQLDQHLSVPLVCHQMFRRIVRKFRTHQVFDTRLTVLCLAILFVC